MDKGFTMKLKIFGKIFRVLKAKNFSSHYGLRGLFDPDKELIKVDSELIGDQYFITIIHELVHGVIYRTGIDQAKLSEGVEEVICENVAVAIVENFKLTPKN